MTEIFGEFRCGKTQLAATLAVTAQLSPESGGASGKVMVLDTENAFRPERIAEIAEKRFQLEPDSVLDNVLIAKCTNHEHQHAMLQEAAAQITDAADPFRLLIIDSIMGLFRVEFAGRGELSERQQKLGQHIHALVNLAQEFNLAVLVTNQVTADPGNMVRHRGRSSQNKCQGPLPPTLTPFPSHPFPSHPLLLPSPPLPLPSFPTLQFVADAKKPVGGHILAHYVHTRVYLRKGKGNQRVAKIYAGPLPEEEATFAITEGGIADAE